MAMKAPSRRVSARVQAIVFFDGLIENDRFSDNGAGSGPEANATEKVENRTKIRKS